MSAKNMRKIQLGLEGAQGAVHGTPVAATTVWRGEGLIDDNMDLKLGQEDVGYLVELPRMYVPSLGAALKVNAGPATFEQLPYILNAGVHWADGVQDGTGSGYVYTYTWPLDCTPADIATYTVRGGDCDRADIMEYGFVSDFTLKGASKEAVSLEANWVGRQATDGAFTDAIAVPSVEEILFGKTLCSVDSTAPGVIGTTILANSLLGFSLKVKTGWTPRWTGDDRLSFTYHAQTGPQITGELVLEHNASGVAELTAARARAVRLLRLTTTSPTQLTTPGTVYTYKTLTLDLAIQYTKIPPLADKDGNDIITLPFRAVYSPDDLLYAKCIVVNELAVLV